MKVIDFHCIKYFSFEKCSWITAQPVSSWIHGIFLICVLHTFELAVHLETKSTPINNVGRVLKLYHGLRCTDRQCCNWTVLKTTLAFNSETRNTVKSITNNAKGVTSQEIKTFHYFAKFFKTSHAQSPNLTVRLSKWTLRVATSGLPH